MKLFQKKPPTRTPCSDTRFSRQFQAKAANLMLVQASGTGSFALSQEDRKMKSRFPLRTIRLTMAFSAALLALPLLASAEGLPRPEQYAQSHDYEGQTLAIVGNESLVDIEGDLAFHKGTFPQESWFVVSNLTADNGDSIGLQVHFLAKTPGGKQTVVAVNVGLINERTGAYKSYEQIYPLKDCMLGTEGMNVRTPEGSMVGDTRSMRIKTEFDGALINLDIKNLKPALVNNAQGRIGFFKGIEQYEYAFTNMPTSGKVTIDGTEYKVDGISWFDRQYGQSTPSDAYEKNQWVWFNPQLDNGVSLSIWQIYELDDNRMIIQTTASMPDGSQLVAFSDPVVMSGFWQSPETGKRFPTEFDMTIPSLDAKLHFSVPVKEQEVLLGELSRKILRSDSKYEGKMIASGTMRGEEVHGEGYVELVGRWK